MLRATPMLLACCVAVEGVPTDLATALVQYGAIGILLGFFVWWSRKDKEQSDTRWVDTNKQLFQMQERQIDALNDATDAAKEQTQVVRELDKTLRERPCMIQKREGGT